MDGDIIWKRFSTARLLDVWYTGQDVEVGVGVLPPEGYEVDPVDRWRAVRMNFGEVVYCAPTEHSGPITPILRRMTLPEDSAARKNIPIFAGVIRYFPAALAEVAKVSKVGNDKHNAGQPLHWARGKSMDHEECVVRHLIDAADLTAARERGAVDDATRDAIIHEKAYKAWRSLADLQLACEELLGAPMAPGARSSEAEGVT